MKYYKRYLSLDYKTNDLIYKHLNTREMNFLMVILSKACIKKEEDNNQVYITRREMLNTLFIKESDEQKTLYKKKWIEMLTEFYCKTQQIILINVDEGKKKKTNMGAIFSNCSYDEDFNGMTFDLSITGQKLTKKLQKGHFFKFFLVEYLMVKNKYAKRLFTEISQLEKIDKVVFPKEVLIKKLGLEKYEETGNLQTKALKPAIEELKIFWPRLKMEPVRRGRTIVAYKFMNMRRYENWDLIQRKMEEYEQEIKEANEEFKNKKKKKLENTIQIRIKDDCDRKLDIDENDLPWEEW